jgi:hypothetical protein
VAVGDAGHVFVAPLPEELPDVPTGFARGWSREGTVQGIDPDRQQDILGRIKTREVAGGRTTTVLDSPGGLETGCDKPG